MKSILAFALVAAATNLGNAPAAAQSSLPASPPFSKEISLTFTGVVTNDVTKSIGIRQPDNSLVPYTGPVPEFPYKKGDPVAISFNAVVPTKAFYDVGYQGQVANDGIYRISIGSQFTVGGGGFSSFGIGTISGPEVSGPIFAASRSGATVRMTIVYDSNSDSYSLEYPNGNWTMNSFNGPSYSYDPVTGAVAGVAAACPGGTISGCNIDNAGGFDFNGTATTGSASIPLYAPSTPNQPPSGFVNGLFNLLFSGSWNLPTFGSSGSSSGGATQVPEPGMMLLFGAGVAALVRRRRKVKAR
jgi:PEP-CTERM motif